MVSSGSGDSIAPAAKRLVRSAPTVPPPVGMKRKADADAVADDTVEVLNGRHGVLRDEFVDVITVSLTDEFYEAADEGTFDKETLKAAELVPGKYFKIGTYQGKACYRQALPASQHEPNNAELFLHFWNKAGEVS